MLVGAKYKSVWKLLASTHFAMEFEMTEKIRQFIERNKLESGIVQKGTTAKLTPETAKELIAVSGLFLHGKPAIASIQIKAMARDDWPDWYSWLGNPDSPFYDPVVVEAYNSIGD
jgi:hypothetical protein